MLTRSSYPHGVPCWLDLIQPDLDAGMDFYARLFGWEYEVRTPPQAPSQYAYARRDGSIAAALGGPPVGTDPTGWLTYVSVDSADDVTASVEAHGGSVALAPVDIPRSGRVAQCVDPQGARFGLWQPAELHGVELVNAAGAWNFSELHTPDPDASKAFYASVFGWECDRVDMGPAGEAWLFRLPGYGRFLAQSDPEIEAWQATSQAPDGFADAVAWLEPTTGPAEDDAPAWWSVTFGVDDAEAAVVRAVDLGATVETPLFDTAYTRAGTVRDPQGAALTLSEYRPPAG